MKLFEHAALELSTAQLPAACLPVSVVWAWLCLRLVLVAKHTASRNELDVVQAKRKETRLFRCSRQRTNRFERRLNELNTKDTLVVQLQDQPPPLAILGLAGQSARQCSGRIWLKNLQFQWSKKRPSTVTQQTAGDLQPRQLTLQAPGR